MTVDRAERPRCENGRHELWPVEEIGTWIHGLPGSPSVREFAAQPDIWDPSRCEKSYEELRGLIETAGGIKCAYALDATTHLDRAIHLGNGVHRWIIARELDIDRVPVQMYYEPEEPGWWRP